jgi:hypothetical protein
MKSYTTQGKVIQPFNANTIKTREKTNLQVSRTLFYLNAIQSDNKISDKSFVQINR